jgi:hypothetical protein
MSFDPSDEYSNEVCVLDDRVQATIALVSCSDTPGIGVDHAHLDVLRFSLVHSRSRRLSAQRSRNRNFDSEVSVSG